MSIINRGLLAFGLGLTLTFAVMYGAKPEGIENPFARGAFEVQGPNNYSAAGGSGPPPSSCTGTIDLSTGCVQPMLR